MHLTSADIVLKAKPQQHISNIYLTCMQVTCPGILGLSCYTVMFLSCQALQKFSLARKELISKNLADKILFL